MTTFLLAIITSILYTVAAFRLWLSLNNASGDNTDNAALRLTRILAIAAWLIHLAITIISANDSRLIWGFFSALSITALCIVLLQLLLAVTRRADHLGLLVYPAAAITLLFTQKTGGQATLDPATGLHALSSIVAYSVLALAATQALVVALQRHQLSHHKPSGFVRSLPPYDNSESLLFLLLTVGFVLLSISLLTGFFYLDDMWGQSLVHKTVLSCLAWAIMGVLLVGRWMFGWRGKRVVNWSVAAFILLVLAFFGSKLVLELILQR
ncbi:MAG: cytochrome c biogenesis protein CcsA [Granulosicoccaceae bacterium]